MSLTLCRQFRTQVLIFLENLIDQFPNESDFLIARIFIKDKLPVVDVIERFGSNVVPYKSQIMKKDEKFFMKNNNIEQKAKFKRKRRLRHKN